MGGHSLGFLASLSTGEEAYSIPFSPNATGSTTASIFYRSQEHDGIIQGWLET